MKHRNTLGTKCRYLPIASRGFTLIELLVVLVIVSLTAGAILPRAGAGWQRMEEREFLGSVVTTLRSARLRAMNGGRVVSFRLNGEERSFGLNSPPEHPIPTNVDLYGEDLIEDDETGEFVIRFFSDGSHTGGKLQVVFDDKRYFLITVHPISGRVEWKAQ